MSRLGVTLVLVGGALVLADALLVVAPARAAVWFRRFPRSAYAAWILTAVDLAWVGWLIVHASLGRFEYLKPLVYILGPAAYVAAIGLMNELLAPRALGGLLLLVPAPMLDLVRWHDSAWRFVVVAVAYLMAIEGIILVLSPYRFRHAVEFWTKTAARSRAGGFLGVAVGTVLVMLGLTVFR
jgi:uncharacterized protein YjeT (DUF2065 family)